MTITRIQPLSAPSIKSTVAKLVAQRLNITYLDTGALYRALGLKCLDAAVAVADAAASGTLCPASRMARTG